MDDDHEHKHTCKFCQKSFPCGRSLGGHMRSHLINISSSDHHKRADNQKLPRKKLPPIIVKTDFSTQFGYGCIDENQNKPLKSSEEEEEEEEDTLLRRKLKECGKSFQSRKALFGLIKSSSVNGKSTHTTAEDDSCDSQSDNEATTLPKKKRSRNRTKRYKVTTNSSSSLTVVNFSPSVSDSIDQQEQEEVALSLIILSGDKADRVGIISPAIESSHNSSDFLEVEKIALTSKFKKLRNGKLGPTKNVLNTRKLGDVEENPDYVQFNEPEVKSPKNSMIKGQFGTIRKKNNKPRKRNKPTETISQDFEKTSKFKCSVCEKAFQSYQALGGHRASHKKFNGCCAPRNENSLEVESSHSKNDYYKELMINSSASKALFGCIKTSKEHECPICFKVFASGQALGGHKRSHLVADHQVKSNASLVNDHKPVCENRDFLDLNLPAPADDDQEECNDSKQWWFD